KWWRKEFQRQKAPTNAREGLISIRRSRTKFMRCFTKEKRQPRRCTIFLSATKKPNNFSYVCCRERFSGSGKLQTSLQITAELSGLQLAADLPDHRGIQFVLCNLNPSMECFRGVVSQN